jgi:hypothetical protein
VRNIQIGASKIVFAASKIVTKYVGNWDFLRVFEAYESSNLQLSETISGLDIAEISSPVIATY